LLAEPLDQLLDVGVDERLSSADRDHRSVALGRGFQAAVQRHDFFQACGVFPDAAAARAAQVAGVERLELKNHGELLVAPEPVFQDVPRDFQ